MKRETLEQIKYYYKRGIYSMAKVDSMLAAGKITQEEYLYIVGENSGE